jgi:hypothetical protein
MRRLSPLLALALAGCGAGFQELPQDHACLEVGYALAHLAEPCPGERSVGNARYEQFRDEYACLTRDEAVEAGTNPEDLYDRAFAIQALPCDVEADFGDDLSQYMAISPGCALVAEPR